jgi:hypothetical protein
MKNLDSENVEVAQPRSAEESEREAQRKMFFTIMGIIAKRKATLHGITFDPEAGTQMSYAPTGFPELRVQGLAKTYVKADGTKVIQMLHDGLPFGIPFDQISEETLSNILYKGRTA